MAEQPETWRTDPRERLLAAIDQTWAYGTFGVTPEQLVDAYAHYLAALEEASPAATQATEPATVNDPEWLRQQIHAAIESEMYEYRERTMLWPEGGVTKEIARLATRGAMEVRDRHVEQLRQRLELADDRGCRWWLDPTAADEPARTTPNNQPPPVAS